MKKAIQKLFYKNKLRYIRKLVVEYNKMHRTYQLKIIGYSFDTGVVWIGNNLGLKASRVFINQSKNNIKEQFQYV